MLDGAFCQDANQPPTGYKFLFQNSRSLENPFINAKNYLDLDIYLVSHWHWSTIHGHIVILRYEAVKSIPRLTKMICMDWTAVKRAFWVIFMNCTCVLDILNSIVLMYKVKKIYSWERNSYKLLLASWALSDHINHKYLILCFRGCSEEVSDKLLSEEQEESSQGF